MVSGFLSPTSLIKVKSLKGTVATFHFNLEQESTVQFSLSFIVASLRPKNAVQFSWEAVSDVSSELVREDWQFE